MHIFDYDGFIYKFLLKFWNIFLIGILWLVCSIPIITIGPASCAAYYAMNRSVRNNEDTAFKDFFRSFKNNFKQGLILTLVYGIVSFAFTFAALFYYHQSGEVSLALRWIFYILILVLLCTVAYAFALLSRFEIQTGRAITYPVAFALMHLKNSIGLIVFRAALVIVLYWTWNTFVFAILLIMLPGFMFFLDTFMIEPVLKKYEPLAGKAENEETKENTDDENISEE